MKTQLSGGLEPTKYYGRAKDARPSTRIASRWRGLGAVISLNNELLSRSTEKFTAVKHSNGSDIWVMTRSVYPTLFKAYLLTSTGLDSSPVISNVGIKESTGIGQMKFSHNGEKLALANVDTSCFELFDFNSFTGEVSNSHLSTYFSAPNVFGGLTYGVEFSPNDSILYCSLNFPSLILKYDLTTTGNPLASYTDVATSIHESLGSLQLALDGNIYVATSDQNGSIGVIQNPNEWNSSFYMDNAIDLADYSSWSLPNFEQSLFRNSSDSFPVSVFTNNESSKSGVIPNPITSSGMLQFENPYGGRFNLTIIDSFGIVRKSIANITSDYIMINCENLQSGIYYYLLSSDGVICFSGNFAIQ